MQCNEVTHYRRQQLTFDVLLTKEPPTGYKAAQRGLLGTLLLSADITRLFADL